MLSSQLSPLKSWAILFTSHCLCLSEETLKAGGLFYLVSMPGEVKHPTRGTGELGEPSLTIHALYSFFGVAYNKLMVAHFISFTTVR